MVFKAIVILQIMMQALLGAAHARVLCIPFCECEEHHAHGGHHSHPEDAGFLGGAHDSHAPRSSSSAGAAPSSCDDHDASPHLTVEEHCGCHLHLPLPGEPQVAGRRQARVDGIDAHVALAPAVVVAAVVDFGLAMPPQQRVRPPDRSMSDQVLALRATRLLI